MAVSLEMRGAENTDTVLCHGCLIPLRYLVLNMATSAGSVSSPPPKAKKQKRLQKYRQEWETDRSWLSRNNDSYKSNCKLCRKKQQEVPTRGKCISNGYIYDPFIFQVATVFSIFLLRETFSSVSFFRIYKDTCSFKIYY